MKAIAVIGLGFGDEGKGTITDALVRKHNSKLVVRFNGGPQAAHNVLTDSNIHHTFSSFGSGTLAGANTLLSKFMLVSPLGMVKEAEVLSKKGFPGALARTYIDHRALVITPYHRALNRLREISRGIHRHGSCGLGIGETMNYAINNPEKALRVDDLTKPVKLGEKLGLIYRDLNKECYDLPIIPTEESEMEFSTFDKGLFEKIFMNFRTWAQCVNVLDEKQVESLIKEQEVTIFEGAQGVLLDENYGYAPHTTWSTTTADNVKKILKEVNYTGGLEVMGVTRTFMTRHGPGRFDTEDPSLEAKFKDPHNVEGRWQGKQRYGHLDIKALKYAIECNKGIDSLAVTCADLHPEIPKELGKVSIISRGPRSKDKEFV